MRCLCWPLGLYLSCFFVLQKGWRREHLATDCLVCCHSLSNSTSLDRFDRCLGTSVSRFAKMAQLRSSASCLLLLKLRLLDSLDPSHFCHFQELWTTTSFEAASPSSFCPRTYQQVGGLHGAFEWTSFDFSYGWCCLYLVLSDCSPNLRQLAFASDSCFSSFGCNLLQKY